MPLFGSYGYINVLYIFVANGYTGSLRQETDEGVAHWLPIQEFLHSPDTVENISLYLEKVVKGDDFYCGIAASNLANYTVNIGHFAARRAGQAWRQAEATIEGTEEDRLSEAAL